MDEHLKDIIHKFEIEVAKLVQAAERIEEVPNPDAVRIALHQAKRVRRDINQAVRELARLRDETVS